MAGKTKRAALVLSPDQEAMLRRLAGSRTAPVREVERAKILLGFAQGVPITDLARQIGVSRPTIYTCIDKALAAGVAAGLRDAYHRPHEPEISAEARAWVVSIACTKPVDHGLAAELWSIAGLARFVASHAEAAGHPRLAQAGKSTVWRILDEVDIKPHKIAYYLERRDPDFDRKMHEVLMVYRDVSIHAEGAGDGERPDPVYTVSVDEKPGVQALGLTAPDLPPVPGKARAIGRDYEYVRHGTCRSWPGSTCIRVTSTPPWRTVTGAPSSSGSSRGSMPTTRPRRSSGWCSITTRPTSARKRRPTSPPAPGASSTSIRPSTGPGST